MYEKILERRKTLCDLTDRKRDSSLLEELYSIDVFFEASINNYKFVYDFAEKNNIRKVYDIGCAHGFQSEMFRIAGIDYEGINTDKLSNFFNSNIFSYQIGEYPKEIRLKGGKDDLAVAILSLTWNCYLYEDDLLEKQLIALKEDFDKILLYTSLEVKFLEKYFRKVEKLEGSFVYLEN